MATTNDATGTGPTTSASVATGTAPSPGAAESLPEGLDLTPLAAHADIVRPALKDITGLRLISSTVDRRTLNSHDFESLNDELVWSADNNFIVSSKGLSAAAVDDLLGTGEFDIV